MEANVGRAVLFHCMDARGNRVVRRVVPAVWDPDAPSSLLGCTLSNQLPASHPAAQQAAQLRSAPQLFSLPARLRVSHARSVGGWWRRRILTRKRHRKLSHSDRCACSGRDLHPYALPQRSSRGSGPTSDYRLHVAQTSSTQSLRRCSYIPSMGPGRRDQRAKHGLEIDGHSWSCGRRGTHYLPWLA